MVWITVTGLVAVSLALFVRKALRDYGDAAAAVDERMRENDADNAMFGQLARPDHPTNVMSAARMQPSHGTAAAN